ncbi:hypothetical protein ZWY2020_048366 [Hordeum vulgare]|nr:hypothetical protein ZWY2020_048366 [Hordeum vulgare]
MRPAARPPPLTASIRSQLSVDALLRLLCARVSHGSASSAPPPLARTLAPSCTRAPVCVPAARGWPAPSTVRPHDCVHRQLHPFVHVGYASIGRAPAPARMLCCARRLCRARMAGSVPRVMAGCSAHAPGSSWAG